MAAMFQVRGGNSIPDIDEIKESTENGEINSLIYLSEFVVAHLELEKCEEDEEGEWQFNCEHGIAGDSTKLPTELFGVPVVIGD